MTTPYSFKSLLLNIFLLFITSTMWSQGIVELNNLNGDIKLTLENSELTVRKDSLERTYRVVQEQPYYKFQNESDAADMINTFGLDTNEINEKFSNAAPELKNAADRLLNKVATSEFVLTLGGNNNNDTLAEEAGGTYNVPEEISEKEASDNKWLYILGGLALAAITGGIGYALGNRKKAIVSTPEKIMETEEKPNDSIETKLSKAKSELTQLKTKFKTLSEENKQLKKEIIDDKSLRKTYFTNAKKELVVPFINAVEKKDAAQSMANLLKMGAHFMSWTNLELSEKVPYDTSNINGMLHQPDANNITTISVNSAPDKTPNNIKFIQELMKKNNVTTLDNAIIFGYKIVN